MPSFSKSHYAKLVNEFLHRWEQQLTVYDAHVLARQTAEWGRVSKAFDTLIADLSERTSLSANQIYRLAEYKRFLEESKSIMANYARFNANLTTIAQKDFATAGMTASNTLLRLIDVKFNQLPIAAINKMIGVTADGSPLYKIFLKRFEDRVSIASDLLVEGIAKGNHPNKIAQAMRSQLDISVYDSTRITRTETLNVYRDISYSNYVNSGIVDSYLWIAESSACPVCLAMERNNPYPISMKPSARHPFDRCTIAPNIA
jgi:SPP1 gp7 family putative phage head morphogenesis protein